MVKLRVLPITRWSQLVFLGCWLMELRRLAIPLGDVRVDLLDACPEYSHIHFPRHTHSQHIIIIKERNLVNCWRGIRGRVRGWTYPVAVR